MNRKDELPHKGNEQDNLSLRTRAEESHRIRTSKVETSSETLSLEETRQLLHELQVHQIELSMQNEELLRTQRELKESRRRYFDLYDLAPVSYCTLDENGLIREANLTLTTLLGVERSKLISRAFSAFIFKEDQDVFYHWRRVVSETDQTHSCELRILGNQLEPFWCQLIGTKVNRFEGDVVQHVALTNIDERKRSEFALTSSEKFAHSILDSIGDHVAVVNEKGVIVAVNEAWRRFAQENSGPADATHWIGVNYFAVCSNASKGLHGEEADSLQAGMHGVANGTLPEFQVEYTCHSPSKQKWFLATVRRLSGSSGWLVMSHRDISEQKISQTALQKSEERLREAQAVAHIGNFYWDAQSNRVSWSEELHRIYGHEPGEYEPTFDNYFAAIHDADRSLVEESLNKAIANRGQFDHTYRIRHEDGRSRWVRARGFAHTDEHGEFMGLEGTCQDVSDQKLEEGAIRERELELRLITNSISGTVSRVDRDLRYQFASSQYEKYFGKTNEQILGHTVREVIGEEMYFRIEPYMKHALAGERVTYESYLQTPSGEIVHALTDLIPVKDRDGQLNGFFNISIDISERKRVEQTLATTTELLERTGRLAKVGGWEYDLQSQKLSWTLETCRIHELDTNVAPTLEEAIAFYSPESRHILESAVHAGIENGTPWDLELPLITAKGNSIWVRAQGLVSLDDGVATKLFGTFQDVTERVEADSIRASLEFQLQESKKIEAIGTLAGGIAHDFNNILAVILGNTDLAERDLLHNDPMIMSRINEIRLASERARDLVKQILSFSRRQPAERKIIDLTAVIDESARLLHATLPARLQLVVQYVEHAPRILANATQVEQVILNIVTNSMQAIPSGPGRIVIELDVVTLDEQRRREFAPSTIIRTGRLGRYLRLTISDDGPGMDEETRARIFEPFFTTKPQGDGTGLGLCVVHGIVQSHEGMIVVESELGRGTSFKIYLPAAPTEATLETTESPTNDVPLPTRPLQPSEPESRKKMRLDPKHILYLDDDRLVMSVVKLLLEENGYLVSSFHDQQEAIEAIRSQPDAFDAIVTDHNMPGMSGLEVVKEIRTIRFDLPIAMTSGFVDDELSQGALEVGAQDVISKPFSMQEFCAMVERLTDRS